MKVFLVLSILLAGCSLYYNTDDPLGDDDAPTGCSTPEPSGAGSCTCSNGTWRCSTCGFQPGPDSTCTPGTSCDYEDWEHGCSCGCNELGLWECANETIGSHCATGQYADWFSYEDLMIAGTAPAVTTDELELIYVHAGPGGDLDLWQATRLQQHGTFGAPIRVAELATAGDEDQPTLSEDSLTLMFTRGGVIMQTHRANRSVMWDPPAPVAELAGFSEPDLAHGERKVIITKNGDLYEATRASTAAPWGTPGRILIGAHAGSLRDDGREVWFASDKLYGALRFTMTEAFESPKAVDFLGVTTTGDRDPAISHDGKTLYFAATVAGTPQIYAGHRERM